MKIAHVISTFPPHVGGMGTVALNEAVQQVAAGHSVTVFTMRYPDTAYHDDQYPFRIIRLKPLFKFGNGGLVPQLFTALKSFDVVHLHYPFYGGAEWVWLWSFIHHRPYVLTYHMDAEPSGRIHVALQKIYDVIFPRFILRQAAQIIAVDAFHFQTTRFRKFLNPERLHIIGNGVDTVIFKPQTVSLASLDLEQWGTKKIILFVGNPIPGKRLDIFLKALAQIQDETIVGVIVGGGYYLDRYKQLARELGVEKRALFVGALHNPERIAQYYAVATCLVVPSTAESFSLVVVEAMASGCPVVATDLPGLKGRIEPGVDGFLVTPGSVDALVAGIHTCLALSPDERLAFTTRARQKMIAQYSWVEHVKKLEAIYREAHI